ncbi:rna-directed dna polymerase from mobile element jockey-like protein, partial [Lasius niger]
MKKEEMVKCDWSQEEIEHYRKEIEGWRHSETGNEELWQKISDKIDKSTRKIKVKKGRDLGKKWFNAEWKKRKRLLRKELRKWRKGKLSREEYVKKRKEYKRWCKEERKRQEKREEKIEKIKTETEAWRYINKFRKKRNSLENSIEMDEWKRHFMEMLEGTEEKTDMKGKKDEREEEEKKEENGKNNGRIGGAEVKAQTFDKVNREILSERMKKIGISNILRNRIMEIYKETKNTIRIGKEESEVFWTEQGVRQGCPISPTLFNIYIEDLEDEMKRGQIGGIKINREKVWSIMYADDVVLLAETEGELKDTMRRFRKYLGRKKLLLNAEKSKVLVFEKGRGKKRERSWMWGGDKIEEVKEIKYLGYILQKNGGPEKQIRESYRKAMVAMKNTWSIGERIFNKDFRRRMKMFKALVNSVALYGAE